MNTNDLIAVTGRAFVMCAGCGRTVEVEFPEWVSADEVIGNALVSAVDEHDWDAENCLCPECAEQHRADIAADQAMRKEKEDK